MIAIARRVLVQHGFEPDAPVALEPLAGKDPAAGARDMREQPWAPIDNAESRGLDQIEWDEQLPGDAIRVLLGIAHVAAYVAKSSPTDRHAAANTTSLYT